MVSKTTLPQTVSKITIILFTTNITSVVSQRNYSCPHPLIYNPTSIPSFRIPTCLPNGCCLPCPIANNFYPSSYLNTAWTLFGSLGLVSLFLMVILIASYRFLPSLNSNLTTRKVLIPFAFSVLIFSASDFFTVQQKRTQCVSPIQQATINDNKLCLIQAFLTLGGAYALACWSALVIVHLHFLSVWRSKFIIDHIRVFHVVIWTISILATIIPIVTHHVGSGNICFITPEASAMFYLPLGFIYVAFSVHVATFIYIANITFQIWEDNSNRSNMSQRVLVNESQKTMLYVREMVRLQWRALAGAFLMVTVYTTAWVFFIFKYKIPDFRASWFKEWLHCLETGTQTSCSSISAPHFPSFPLIVWILFIKRCVGIFIFIILAAKKSVFSEWMRVLRGNSKPEGEASRDVVQVTSV